MDTLEQGIQTIDAHTQQAIKKHKDILAQTIYNTANKSNKSAINFDKQYNKYFTESESLGVTDGLPFNPHTVVEMRNGKSNQVIDTWDKGEGILPDRKVMGEYYVDIGIGKFNTEEDIFYCPQHKNIQNHFTYNGSQCKTFNQAGNSNPSNYRMPQCNCNFYNQQIYIIPKNSILKDINKSYQRGEDRGMFISKDSSLQFEVDNYLNLYHKTTGLYIMFHKTSFPNICFHMSKEITQLEGSSYFQIYLSKRLEKMDLELTQTNYSSMDNREKFLKDILELVPDNYDKIYNLYNNFRKMQTFSQSPEELELEKPLEGKNILDSRDRLIEGLQRKLNETVIRCEKAEGIVSEMAEGFNEKSMELQNINREKDLIEMKIKEMELDIEKIKKEYEQKEFDKKETESREHFDLYQRLSEAETFRAKSESLGISMESLRKDLEKETLDNKRIKDLNKGLMVKIKDIKTRFSDTKQNNEELFKQIQHLQEQISSNKEHIAKITKELESKNKECWILGEKMSEVGKSSDDALENALGDMVEDLKEEIKKLKEENSILEKDKKKIDSEFSKVKSVLSHLNL